MDVKDFLPKYPNIVQTDQSVLNPYEEDFYTVLFHKKEFYENRLGRADKFPRGRGLLTKYQRTVVRYISEYTPYDRLLLVHFMGSGKTCSAIGAIEHIKQSTSNYTSALILGKGPNVLRNFTRELVHTCTPGYYIPENYNKLTAGEKIRRIRKNTAFYKMKTFATFASELSGMTDGNIVDSYSNRIIVVDEAHNLRIQPSKKEAKNAVTRQTYEQLHRFFHLVRNCKILFLTGTPMKDSPEEIASLLNLLLPMDKQFPTEEDFLETYMEKRGNAYVMKENMKQKFKDIMKGYVSFLREAESAVPVEYIGKKDFKGVKHFVLAPNTMSEFQTKGYKRAYDMDENSGGVYINARSASLFVFPDGSVRDEGFKKYVEQKRTYYRLKPELLNALSGQTNQERLKKLRKYSATYAQVIEELLKVKGNCFVYCSLVKGSGAILFSLILEQFGFSSASGSEKEKRPRYALLTDKMTDEATLEKIIEKYNSKENKNGEYIKILIGTRATSEAFSFKNVIFEAILTPHWNYSEIAQALARGIRLNSHRDIEAENPKVRVMQVVSMPDSDVPSIDLHNWRIAEDKDVSIANILRLLMECAFDCALNYLRNRIEGKDGQRSCDYTVCRYKCDGIDMNEVENELSPNDLDYSTYQLYYANPKTPLILKKIDYLLRQTKLSDVENIVRNLSSQFTAEEIRASIYALQEQFGMSSFNYYDFLQYYAQSPVKLIMYKIEELFQSHFQIHISEILKQFQDHTEFEVITALQTLINESIPVINRYGFVNYIREENNVFFLVNSLTVKADFYTNYYAEYPHCSPNYKFDVATSEIKQLIIPRTIRDLCKMGVDKLKRNFRRIINTLPLEVQETMIQASLSARDMNSTEGRNLRDIVIEYFKSYIHQLNDTHYVTLNESNYSCNKIGGGFNGWKRCTDQQKRSLIEQEAKQKEQQRENNPYGLIGKWNPQNNEFCIVDFFKERELLASKGRATDKRLTFSGKVCTSGGWKLFELVSMAIKRLQIDPPDTFTTTLSDEKMRKMILEDIQGGKSVLKDFSVDEIKSADHDTLKRMIYWGFKKPLGNTGIKPICSAMREWFEKNNLLDIDNQCGVQGKRKIVIQEEKKGGNFLIKAIDSAKNNTEYQAYKDQIIALTSNCYKRDIDVDVYNQWFVVFSKKKIVAVAGMKNPKIISLLCFNMKYDRSGIPAIVISQLFEHIQTITGSSVLLEMNNKESTTAGLIKFYTKYGMIIHSITQSNTYMNVQKN